VIGLVDILLGSPPSQMCENIIKYLMKFDPNVSLKMTYEDEFRNFVGKLWIDAAEGELYN
jgi:hypothetical protein